MLRTLIIAAAVALAGCSSSKSTDPLPLIDINSATVYEFRSLPGVSLALARKIVETRNARGGKFEQIDDLLDIDGIGPNKLDSIREYIVLYP